MALQETPSFNGQAEKDGPQKVKEWPEINETIRRNVSHCGRGRRVLQGERSYQQHQTQQPGDRRWAWRQALQLLTSRPFGGFSEGRSSGMMQKETGLEEAKWRITRFVMEMAIKKSDLLRRISVKLGERKRKGYCWWGLWEVTGRLFI